jgi:hypothetical protein
MELVGVEELNAAFLNESRTRGRVQRSVQEIRVAGGSIKGSALMSISSVPKWKTKA